MADKPGPSRLTPYFTVNSYSQEKASLLNQISWDDPDYKHNEYLEIYQILSDDVNLKRTRKRTFAFAAFDK